MKKLILSLISLMLASASFGQADYSLVMYFTFDDSSLVLETRIDVPNTYFSEYSWIYFDTTHAGNQWQIGRPQKTVFNAAHSLPNALVTDTVNTCLPNDTSIVIFKVPMHLWLGIGGVSFFYKLNIDSGDIAAVDWSADTGATWSNVLADTGLFTTYGLTDSLVNTGSQWDSITLYAQIWEVWDLP